MPRKINTPEKFIAYLKKLLEQDGRFEVYVADKNFKFKSNEIAVQGIREKNNEDELFCFEVEKVNL